MSRSKPTDNSPNPSTRWFEWAGGSGEIKYYDKELKETVTVDDKFTFILLDQLATIKGWHDPSEAGIFSNEVRDTRSEILLVKTFKGKTLVEGIYSQIKDQIKANGGHFTANLYIAYKEGTELKMGSLQFKGAALGTWMEFTKAFRNEIWKQAITINGSTEGKKGSVKFKTPNFDLKPISEETNQKSMELDRQLQTFLESYLKRTHVERADDSLPGEEDYNQANDDAAYDGPTIPEDDDSIHF